MDSTATAVSKENTSFSQFLEQTSQKCILLYERITDRPNSKIAVFGSLIAPIVSSMQYSIRGPWIIDRPSSKIA